jgi:uncharacterized protein YkwD
MNYIDIILLVVMLLCIWLDIKRGFITSSLILLSWIGSLVIGFAIYETPAAFLHKLIPSLGFWAAPLAFILIITIARFVLDTIISRILDDIPESTHTNLANKVLGIIPGIVNGFIWSALLATVLLLMPLIRISQETRDAKLTEGLITKVSTLERRLAPIFSEALNSTVNKKTVVGHEEGDIKLPFIAKHAIERPDLEKEMLVLVNREREKKGLKRLEADPEIALVALKHSEDMLARGYFSHYTPEGLNPFDRMKKGHVRFYTAGENLALAQTLPLAHTGLMNSPGHRANILNPTFGRLGIGILDAGIYGLMITQNFRN